MTTLNSFAMLLSSLPKILFAKYIIFAWLLTLALLASNANAAGAPPCHRHQLTAVPTKPEAPDFTLTDTKGNTHTLSKYRGKVVIVNFWNVYCAPCRKEMPSMQRAWEQMREQDVVLLAVNYKDKSKDVDVFFNSIPVPTDFPVLLGGDRPLMDAWFVKGFPTTYVVDPEGRWAYCVTGELEWDQRRLMNQMLSLRAK